MSISKRYKKYKPSNVDFIGEVPEHWEVRKLKFIAKIKNGKDQKEIINENGKYPIFGSGGIFCYGDEFLYDKPSVLFGRKGTIDKPLYVEKPFWTVDTMFYSEIKDNLNPKFFYLLTTIIDFHKYKSGSVLPSMTQEVLSNIRLPLPAIKEQEKIANFLDIKNRQIEEFIKDKENQIALLQEQKEAIINKAVTKGLDDSVEFKDSGIEWIGDIPQSWDVMKTTYLFSTIGSGTTPLTSNSDYYTDGNIYWVNSGDLNNGHINTSKKLITKQALEEVPSLKMYKKGGLIIAMYGATIGKLGLLNINATLNQACCILDNSDKMINKFAFYWFLVNKQNIINLGIGGGQPNISQDIIKSLRIQTPLLNEQKQIIKYIEIENTKIDKLINQIQKECDLIKEYKISLISEVVTGQVDVR